MSAGLTSPERESRRFRRDDFLVRMCSTFAWRRMILPVPDTRNRFAAARFVFILGMSSSVLETTSGCNEMLHPLWSGPRERRVGAGGIEPPTPSVSGKCSPAELSACERHPLPGDAVYTVRVLHGSSKMRPPPRNPLGSFDTPVHDVHSQRLFRHSYTCGRARVRIILRKQVERKRLQRYGQSAYGLLYDRNREKTRSPPQRSTRTFCVLG